MGIGAWEHTSRVPNILIGIPNVGHMTPEWALALCQLRSQTPFPIGFSFPRGLPFDVARNNVVDVALGKNAQGAKYDYVFFLDSDVIVPPDAIVRLYDSHFPIISGVYHSKRDCVCAWKEIPQDDPTYNYYNRYIPLKELKSRWLDVDVVGSGCILIDTRVFEQIERPYYYWEVMREGGGAVSEDFHFCEKARRAGFKIMLDTSVLCGHEILAVMEANGEIRTGRL